MHKKRSKKAKQLCFKVNSCYGIGLRYVRLKWKFRLDRCLDGLLPGVTSRYASFRRLLELTMKGGFETCAELVDLAYTTYILEVTIVTVSSSSFSLSECGEKRIENCLDGLLPGVTSRYASFRRLLELTMKGGFETCAELVEVGSTSGLVSLSVQL